MATVLITGGTGLIGTALTKALLAGGYNVIILTRQQPVFAGDTRLSYALWDIASQRIEAEAIAKADHLIHLAGANVGEKRWTRKRKKEIVDSRVRSSELLVKAMSEIPNRIQTVVSASAIGWYGPDPEYILQSGENKPAFVEEDLPANDFLGETCRQWEAGIEPVARLGKRLVKLRIGIVLSKKGGALAELEKPLHWGIAAILGNGKQVFSWIHIDDLIRLYIAAIENKNLSGVYNAVAPQPVSNKELVLQLARSTHRFFIPVPVPAFALRLLLGEMSSEVVKSATVSSAKVQASGFVFQYPGLSQLEQYFKEP